jgi:hypothetical protein
MNLIKPLLSFLFTAIALSGLSQTVVVQNVIKMPADTAVKKELIGSLNGFIKQLGRLNKNNDFILKEDLLEMSGLADEISGMEQGSKAKDFFKCYITNVVKINEYDYLVQFSYLGITDNSPVLRASFKVIAKRVDHKFYFSSPLRQNTIGWKAKKFDNVTYYYKDTLNIIDAKAFVRDINYYDKLINTPQEPVAFYCCNNIVEAGQLLGVDFKLDYNGMQYSNFTAHNNNQYLVVSGRISKKQRYNPHDLWHDQLHSVISIDTINRPVDEGCAYLFGGSWDYTWAEVLARFKKYAAENPNADWLNLYINNTKFANDSQPLVISYALNALIVQKIKNEQGFPTVIKLITCGKRQTGDENYFAGLNKLSGINKANFNAKMWELINAAR